MGIFKIFKKDNKKPKEEFTSQIVQTENVSETLTNISQRYHIPLSSLDFDILDVDTLVKLSKDDDFVLADSETIKLIKDKDLLLDENFEIKQSYEIKVRKYRFFDDFELLGKLEVNKTLTKAIYLIDESSLLIYNDMLEIRMIEELKKKKLKSGILIDTNLFESDFYNSIKQLVAKIRVLGELQEKEKIILCEGIPPIPPRKLEIIEYYKINKKHDSRIKDLIYPIKKGDIVIEIIKPKPGRNGRSCRGKFIKVADLEDIEIPTYLHKDDIEKIEDENKIRYIAQKNGYVYIKDFTITIKDELEVNQISLKTGNVTGAEDSDIKLEVKESGVLKEAIKDGMIVETTELIVKGNVGNGAKIKAKRLEIDGQTHRKSKILAQNAQINSHKGYLKANTALIHRLEGGVVEAKQVHIDQAISGKVIAREISIDILGSHVTLIASELIEIQNLKGSENRLIIDEAIVSNKESYLEELHNKIQILQVKINKYKDKLKDNKQIIIKNKDTIDRLKLKVKENKEKNIPINPLFIQKIKRFNDFVKKTKMIEQEIKNLILKQKKIKKEIAKVQAGVFLAKIISHNGFNEFNRIEFHLTEPPLKIVYDTKKTDKLKNIFMLRDYGEMDFKIVGESE